MSAGSCGPCGLLGIRTMPSLVCAFLLLGVLIASSPAVPVAPPGTLLPLNGETVAGPTGSHVIRAIHADGAPAPPGDTNRAADASPGTLPEAFRSLPESDQQTLLAAFRTAQHAVIPLTAEEAALPQNAGVRYFASNPGQHLTARFLDGAVRLEPSRGGDWQVTFRLSGVDGQVPPVASENRVLYRHPGDITEWYANREGGLEHGFTVEARPDSTTATGELRLKLGVEGLRVRQAAQPGAVDLVDESSGGTVLRYDRLKAQDATGKALPARLEASDGGLALVVADGEARYPLTIDPWITTPEAQLAPVDETADAFGGFVAFSGTTALVGACTADSPVASGSGCAYVFLRESSGAWTELFRLTAPDGAAGDEFGRSIAHARGMTAVGAPGDDSRRGAVYVFNRGAYQAKLTASDGVAGDELGYSVIGNGLTVDAGAPGTDDRRGSVYSFYNSAFPINNWSEKEITALDGAAGDEFGYSVGSSSWGFLLIGAPGKDGRRGAIYQYAGSSAQVTLTAPDGAAGDEFGCSMATSGDTALVGARGNDSGSADAGAAYMFVQDVSTGAWSEPAKLTASDPAAGDGFGWSVAVAGESEYGGATALVGAPNKDGARGSAYMFARNSDGSWAQQARWTGSDGETGDRLGCSVALSYAIALVGVDGDDNDVGPGAGSVRVFIRTWDGWSEDGRFTGRMDRTADHFGCSVALSGNWALIGAYMADSPAAVNSGCAYVFERDANGVWTQRRTLTASDGATGDEFGRSVSCSYPLWLVGSPGDDGRQGSAYGYYESSGTWHSVKMRAPDGAAGDEFGRSTAISGATSGVGAPGKDSGTIDSGAVYIFVRFVYARKLTASDAAASDAFGASVAFSGENEMIFGAPGKDTARGSAYIFTGISRLGNWSEHAQLTASDGAAGDAFGCSVAVSGDTALVGACGSDGGAADSGSAYVFVEDATSYTWSQQARLAAPDAAESDHFGSSVALSGQTALVGAPGDDTSRGSAYAFARDGTIWSQQAKLTAPEPADNDAFGCSVALSGERALIGTDGFDTVLGADAGRAFAFRFQNTPPSLVSPIPDQIIECGAPFTFTFDAATFSEPDPGQSLTYSASGMPAGVVLDGMTRTFNGTPAETGAFPITVVATDTNATPATVEDIFLLTVRDIAPPSITCPLDITQSNDPEHCGAVVTYTTPVGTDNCSGATTVQTAGQPSGAFFPVGTTVNTFVVTDCAGLTATCSFTVTVNDTQVPVITLLGANPMTVECAQYGPGPSTVEWGDPGATVTDNCDAMRTITSTSTVLKDIPNSYVVTYTARDAAGNPAESVTRTVIVVDTQPPVITLHGDNPLRVSKGGPFADPGATVFDACATGLVASVSGTVDVNTPGDYVLTYTATDGTNEAVPVTRTVKVNHPPVTENFSGASMYHLDRWGEDINLAARTSDADGDPLTYTVGAAAHGTVTVNAATGLAHYTPIRSHDFVGSDAFTYTASDGMNSSTSIVTVSLWNDTPMLDPDFTSASVSHKAGSEVDFEYSALDEDGDRVSMQVVTRPTYGTLTWITDDEATYEAGGANVASDTFTLRAVDPHGAGESQTFTVILTNAAPVAGPGTASVPHKSTTGVDIDLRAFVSDAETDPLTFSVGTPDYGTVTVNPVTGLGHYTPGTSDTVDPAHFTYTANDGRATSSAGTVTATLTNSPPTATVSLSPLEPKVADPIVATASGADADGDPVTLAYVWYHNNTKDTSQTTATYTGTKAKGDKIEVYVFPDDGHGTGLDAYAFVTVAGTGPAAVLGEAADPTKPYGDETVQYSDPIREGLLRVTEPDGDTVTATMEGAPPDITLIGVEPEGSNTWTLSGLANVGPGAYPVTITVSDVDGSVVLPFTITILPEDGLATYTGALYVATESIASGRATVMLAATIADITAGPDEPEYDPNAGDITNATVTFVNRETGAILAANVPLGLLDPDDPTVAIATADYETDIGAADLGTLDVGILVGGWYACDETEYDTLVNISKPIPNFITGGGYLVNAASAGQKAGTSGLRTNFSFGIKYNKGLKNLQGRATIIVRSGGSVYLIKSSAIQTLAVKPPSGTTPGTATFTSRATIQEVSNPEAPVSIDGNASLQITMTDRGEPGTSDTIAITLYNKSGGLWFTGCWTGRKPAEQTLAGGNVVVR